MRSLICAMAGPLATALVLGGLAGQAPRAQSTPVAATAPQKVAPPAAPPQAKQPTPSAAGGAPPEGTLGLPVFPGAQFLASYDAGRGQRFYLYGTTASFTEVIAYYKAILKEKGELVFDDPGVYVFDIGKFREDTMAFPPGITVKDFSGGTLKGYLNPKPGGQPPRFPTVVQIVPLSPASTASPKL